MASWEEWCATAVYAEWCRKNSGHVDYVCPGKGTSCEMGACMFCDGGLTACVRCDAFEGATPSECPGVKMTADQADRVYECIIDYRFGQWVSGGCVTMYRPPHPDAGPGLTWDWREIDRYLAMQEYEPMVVDA